MARSLIKYSLLTVAAVGYVAAQDSGEGFVFKCDKPGHFALTFDDGPSEYTGTLLNTLKENNIKATFFSVGTQAANKDISKYLKQAYDEGHQIASHTNTHADLNKLSVEQIRKEMKATEDAIKNATGVIPAMMRPPYGNCNAQCRGVMKEMGYTVVQWSVDSNDWKYMGQPDKWDTLISNIGNVVTASDSQKDSFISLQHDIHKFSVDRTPKVIEIIKKKGYTFVTVSECLSNRIPMYQNLPNPSGTGTSSISTPTATPSGNVTSTTTSGATSPSSSGSSIPTTSVKSESRSPSPTSQKPTESAKVLGNSAYTSAPTLFVWFAALYFGYYNQA